jgi:hypothetical protein
MTLEFHSHNTNNLLKKIQLYDFRISDNKT